MNNFRVALGTHSLFADDCMTVVYVVLAEHPHLKRTYSQLGASMDSLMFIPIASLNRETILAITLNCKRNNSD